jgi:hypothetical protein
MNTGFYSGTNYIINLKNCSKDADHYDWNLDNPYGADIHETQFEPQNRSYPPGVYTIKLTAYSSSEVKKSDISQTFTVN